MENNEKILNKIRKLLTLATDQAGRPEGDTAAELAARLMMEAGIEEVELGTTAVEDPLIEHSRDLGDASTWRADLAHAVAVHCELFGGNYRGTQKFAFWGRSSRVAVASYLFDVLANQIERKWMSHRAELESDFDELYRRWNPATGRRELSAVGKSWSKWDTMTTSERRSARLAFCVTATSVLNRRLREMRAVVESKSEVGTGIVLAHRQEAENFAREKCKFSKGHKTERKYSGAGAQAGHEIHINDALNTTPAAPQPLALGVSK